MAERQEVLTEAFDILSAGADLMQIDQEGGLREYNRAQRLLSGYGMKEQAPNIWWSIINIRTSIAAFEEE